MLSLMLREVSGLLKTGQVTSTELCLMCLKRLRAVHDLNAVTTLTPSEAQKQAEKSSQRFKKGEPLSSLDGISVLIKDNYSTQGVRTTCGSKILDNYVSPYNATVVHRLLNNGSVILGKSNMDEFAMGSGSTDSFYGPVRNPWKYKFKKESIQRCPTPGGTVVTDKGDSLKKTNGHLHSSVSMSEDVTSADKWFVPGGSSGGSAAAVASGACYFGIGSDTGGSVRIPASFCGIVGLKPTYGLISRHGLISLVNSMDVPGIFTRSIDDAVEVLNALAGHDMKDSTTVPDQYVPFTIPDELSMKDVHIGIPKDFSYPGLTSEVKEAWTMLADSLDKAGAKVSQVSLPHSKYCLAIYTVLCCCEVASNMARYDGIEFGHRADVEDSIEALFSSSRHQGFNDVVRGRILCGNYFLLEGNYEDYFIKAQKVRRMLLDDFTKVYQSGVDIILTPTTLNTALSYRLFEKQLSRAKLQTQDIYTIAANLAGIPAVNVPIQVSGDGLPISLQLMGQAFKEKQMLTVAKWIEQEMNFPYLNLDYLD